MGLRLKLGLYVVGFVGAVLALAGVLGLRAETEFYRREAESRGLTLLRAFAIPCTIAMANNDISTLDNYVVKFSEAAQSLDLDYMVVLDYSRRVTAHTSPGEFGKIYDDAFTMRATLANEPVMRMTERGDDELLEIAVPVVSGLRWGTIRAGFSQKTAERALLRSRSRLLWTGLGVLVGSAGVAYIVLSFLVLRPVMRMRDMARQFGSGDLKARVAFNPEKANDEMTQLSTALNNMAQQLEDYTGSLEDAVQTRTSELEETNEKLTVANQQLERLARTDGLTGLYNRRHFMEQLHFEIRRGSRTKHQFAIIMMDVDHFKHYNDTNGHTAGDELLQRLAALLQINLRSTDVVARYGGEEFIILLLDTPPDEGFATAKKLQQIVGAQPLPNDEKQPLGKITVSVGVSFYPHDSVDARTLIEYADQGLYRSKQNGRNQVSRYAELVKKA